MNLFLQGGNTKGKICLEIHQSLIAEHYLNLKLIIQMFIYLTQKLLRVNIQCVYMSICEVTYIWMLKLKKHQFIYIHEWDLEELSKILNLSLNSNYFKRVNNFKRYVLEPVKKDLENTDIIFTYELIKVGRKFNKIILNTHLDLEKFNAQNSELERVPTKKEYVNHSKLILIIFKENKKSKIIDQPILSDEEVKKIWKILIIIRKVNHN